MARLFYGAMRNFWRKFFDPQTKNDKKKIGFQNSKPGQILSQFAGFLYKLKLFCHLWVETPKKFFVNFFTNNLTPKNFFYAKNQK